MQREILFRGKRTGNGNWVQGCLLIDDMFADKSKWHYNIVFRNERVVKDIAVVIPETVGQYTGLTDKNGNKIFEGDILKAIVKDMKSMTNKEAYWSVEYKERFTQENSYYCYGINRRWNRILTQSIITNCQCEIIGNIYDNPELLEV